MRPIGREEYLAALTDAASMNSATCSCRPGCLSGNGRASLRPSSTIPALPPASKTSHCGSYRAVTIEPGREPDPFDRPDDAHFAGNETGADNWDARLARRHLQDVRREPGRLHRRHPPRHSRRSPEKPHRGPDALALRSAVKRRRIGQRRRAYSSRSPGSSKGPTGALRGNSCSTCSKPYPTRSTRPDRQRNPVRRAAAEPEHHHLPANGLRHDLQGQRHRASPGPADASTGHG